MNLKNIEEYLSNVADIKDSEIPGDDGKIYVSKYDGSYITRVGLEDDVKFLLDRGITENLQHGVGFSPKENKWYGWSHRAIYGFTIGSTCKKGHCHYNGSNLDEQREAAISFWDDDGHNNVRCEGIVEKDGDRFFKIVWDYDCSVPNESLHGTIGSTLHYIKALGNGEWVAKTMEDAKQMAVDFNEGVS